MTFPSVFVTISKFDYTTLIKGSAPKKMHWHSLFTRKLNGCDWGEREKKTVRQFTSIDPPQALSKHAHEIFVEVLNITQWTSLTKNTLSFVRRNNKESNTTQIYGNTPGYIKRKNSSAFEFPIRSKNFKKHERGKTEIKRDLPRQSQKEERIISTSIFFFFPEFFSK